MIAKFPGKCRCGERVAAGTTIVYKSGVVGCPACDPTCRGAPPPARSSSPAPRAGSNPEPAREPAGPAVEIRVRVQAVKWSSPDGAKSIVLVRPEGALPPDSPIEDGASFAILGRVGQVNYGDMLDVKGVWQKNDRFGHQLQLQLAVPVVAGTDAALLKFLQRFPGVGPANAEKILRHFGSKEAVVDVLEHAPGRLAEIAGISQERAAEIGQAFNEAGAMKAVLMFLDGLGVGPTLVERIIETWGAGAMENIQDDPYILTQIDGIAFPTADKIARKLGLSDIDPRRLAAAAETVIREAEEQGHTWSNFGDLTHVS